MSAAQTPIDPDAQEILDEELEVKRGRPKKDRNISRRNVVNLPDELAFYLTEHRLDLAASPQASTVPQVIRQLVVDGLRHRGITMQDVRLEWRREQVRRATAELEEAEKAAGKTTGE